MTARKLKLTKTNIEKIEPTPSRQAVYWDSEIDLFGLRVSPGGTRAFFFQGRLNGEEKKYSIGRYGHVTPEQARTEAKRIRAMLALGRDPRPSSQKTGGTSFGDLMTAYVSLLEAKGKESARKVRNAISRDVEKAYPRLWKKPAREISVDDCLSIVGKLVDAGKPRQADKLRAYIRAAFAEAIGARGDATAPPGLRTMSIQTNPARDLKKVRGSSRSRDRALTLSELRHYWRRVNALSEPHKSIAVMHLLTGGQRIAQLARSTLADLDRDHGSLTLWDAKGRREHPRRHVIPLLPAVTAAIDRITGGGAYIFSCDGGKRPANERFLGDIVNKICGDMAKAGELEMGRFTAGTIRATIETRLAAAGVSSDVLAHLLSHGMGGIQSRHYQKHSFFQEKQEALQKLQALLEIEQAEKKGGSSDPGQ